MRIYFEELKKVRFQTILWTLILSFILVIFLSMYPSYYENKDSVTSALNSFPDSFLKALGISLETIFTPLGFYAFLFEYIMILGAIQSALMGVKIIANDKIFQTQEFLFTRPIKRHKILTSKIMACVTSLIITNVIFHILSIVLISFINTEDSINLLQLFEINSSLLLLQITFLAISMVFAAFIKKPKTTMSISLIVVFGFYLLSLVEELFDLILLRYINPFSYFKISDIVIDGSYKASFIVATVFIIIFCLNFTYRGYETEDIL